MAYRSIRIRPASGVEIVRSASPEGRLRNALLDALLLPFVYVSPRRSVRFNGRELPLHYEFRRWTWRSERCLEIALGSTALRNYPAHDVLEVGNVLSLAYECEHLVVDKYEAGPGIVNEDVLEFAPRRTFDLVISISTIEHVGWDEIPQDVDKASRALEAVSELGRDLLVTIPVGYHPKLSEDFINGPFDEVLLFRKLSRPAKWTQCPLDQIDAIEYGKPYACGNGILVGMRGNPLGAGASLTPSITTEHSGSQPAS